MIGRAGAVPLPDTFQERLGPALARFREAATNYLRQISTALIARRTPPALDALDEALGGYTAAIEALRSEGLTRKLLGDVVERIFTLHFALEQLRQNFRDLERCVAGFSRSTCGHQQLRAHLEAFLMDYNFARRPRPSVVSRPTDTSAKSGQNSRDNSGQIRSIIGQNHSVERRP